MKKRPFKVPNIHSMRTVGKVITTELQPPTGYAHPDWLLAAGYVDPDFEIHYGDPIDLTATNEFEQTPVLDKVHPFLGTTIRQNIWRDKESVLWT